MSKLMARPSHYQILKKMGIVTGHFNTMTSGHCIPTHSSGKQAQLYIPSTTNIELILWQTQLIGSADNVNHGFFLSLFQLISCPSIALYESAYFNFIFEF